MNEASRLSVLRGKICAVRNKSPGRDVLAECENHRHLMRQRKLDCALSENTRQGIDHPNSGFGASANHGCKARPQIRGFA